MLNIKNIILDLGGVLFDLDYQKTQLAFSKLGLDEVFSKKTQNELFDDLEEGKISGDDFLTLLSESSTLSIKPTKNQLIQAWNDMLLGIPNHQFELLEELKSKYRLFLFSNTNEIHIKAVWEHLIQKHNKQNLDEYFEVVYLSNELGIRKPKPHSFDYIIKQNNLNPTETLFIDDSPQHVEGAKKAGINSFWLDLEIQDLRGLLRYKNLI